MEKSNYRTKQDQFVLRQLTENLVSNLDMRTN
jgi:hypothetical protein